MIVGHAPGVAHTVGISGQSLILNANAPNLGSMYVMLKPFDERRSADLSADAIAADLQKRCHKEVSEAIVAAFGAPPIDGLGTTGGFKMIIEDRGNLGLGQLQRVSDQIVDRGNRTPGLKGLFNSSGANTPWLYLEIDRTKCEALGISVADLFNTLQVYFGSYYVNNFNEFGRTWQVNVQADPQFRNQVPDVRQLQVRNNQGQMVRLATLMDSARYQRPGDGHALQPVLRRGNHRRSRARAPVPGRRSTLAQQIAEKELPHSMAYEWTDLAFLQLQAGNSAMYFFGLAVLFVFLVLAAQYESWSMPLAVILVVPMCLLFSVTGIQIAHNDVNIFTQIGFVVLVGLASKNAILIVEFAKVQHEAGVPRREAILESRAAAIAADFDDLVRLHSRRRAAGDRHRRRFRNAPHAGNRRVQRHAGRNALRRISHADFLLRHSSLERSPQKVAPHRPTQTGAGTPSGQRSRGNVMPFDRSACL